MKPLNIRGISFGEGIPKICVPITGTTQKEIETQAARIRETPAQAVEWRADWFYDILDPSGNPNTEAVTKILKNLRDILGEIVLLFTFRTAKEGGEKAIRPESYQCLNLAAAKSGFADLIDIELFTEKKLCQTLAEEIHQLGMKVIISNHDFEKTPDCETLVKRLSRMEALGADMAKIAVMPQSSKDVLVLLSAAEEFSRIGKCPGITMSMAGLGTASRILGEFFHSAMTFGAVGRVSAPGQLDVNELYTILNLLHQNL